MTASIPAGTVTFLFTDIEGSTQLWEKHPEEMKAALAQHDALLGNACKTHNGYVFKTVGDAVCAAFATAPDALNAALAAQRQLQAPLANLTLKVRMALHTGTAEERDGDYFGPPLNRVARLLSAGYGGQTLLSLASQELVRDQLPVGVTLCDMGERRLKDLVRPERVFQVIVPDLPTDFPPLKTLDTLPNNLPLQLTSFVGREKEMAEIKDALAIHRLVTLTGSGGAGKTRLSLQVAADVLDDFAKGVWLVELAPLTDPALVPQTVATALGVPEQPGQPIQRPLTDYLREKTLLLILDNCEHLVQACAALADALLHACPGLKILASSREALGIAGEVPFRVPSLSNPDPRHLPPIETLSQYEAVRLFIERATTVLPTFAVTNQNAPALAQICHRLDGIPLAIELAAARVKLLRVEQIAIRLDDAFRLLTGGSRTALPRQQTLKALIDWSYALLSESERKLLQRLSVFAGGWTLEAAESVCADPESQGPRIQMTSGDIGLRAEEILDLLTLLVDKSLVLADRESGQETRYRLLETVRQYAREKLVEATESERIQGQHLGHFLKFAEEAESHLFRAEQVEWLERLDKEYDNLRAALEWAVNGEWANTPEAGLRLAHALTTFWYRRGHWREAREWLARALATPGQSLRTMARARALASLALFENDWKQAIKLLDESLALSRELGDKRGLAEALLMKGINVRNNLSISAGKSLLEESLNLCRETDDKWGIARAYYNLGIVTWREYDVSATRHFFEESLKLSREIGERRFLAISVMSLGGLLIDQGDLPAARALVEESLSLGRELGDKHGMTMYLGSLGYVALGEGNYQQAEKLLEEGLVIARDLGSPFEIADRLCDLGRVVRFRSDYEQAAKLYAESIAYSREGGDNQTTSRALCCLGELARLQGDYAGARSFYIEALGIARETDDRRSIATLLEESAGLSAAQQQPKQAATLFGASEALREAIHIVPLPVERSEIERNIAAARAQLDEATFAVAWAEGRTMPTEQVMAYALESMQA